MCGFGDKVGLLRSLKSHADADVAQDRRPITPPPCIRLVVMDKMSGKEVDCK